MADDADDSTTDLNRAMIAHHVETGHAVERADSREALEHLADGRAAAGRFECDCR